MMPAGTYYVGDLSFFLQNEWDQISRLTIHAENGEFVISKNRYIALYEVPCNGVYTSNMKTKHKTTSLTIGCMNVSCIKGKNKDFEKYGAVIDFTEPFTTFTTDDSIVIGHLRINTQV